MNAIVMIFILSALVSLILLYLSIFKSKRNNTVVFSYLVLHIFIYILGVVIEVTSVGLWQAKIAVIFEYLGFSFIGPFFLLLVCEYTENKINNKLLFSSMFIIPIISFILVLTFPINGLFYEEFDLAKNLGIYYLKFKGSIYRDILYIYFVILILISIYIMIKAYYKGDRNIKGKISFIIKGMIIPFAISILYLFNLTPYGIDITPAALLFLCLYYGYNIMFKEFFITTRFARSYVLNNLNTGYILTDENDNYIDSNIITKAIFPSLESSIVGLHISEYKGLPEIFFTKNKQDKVIDFNVTVGDSTKYFNIQKSQLQKNKKSYLNCWLIYDVTSQVEIKQRLHFMATHDYLTKIYNRNTFYKLGTDLFFESVNNKTLCAVAMIDIDFFKKINDTYGHLVGDKVICNMVNKINSNIRDKDIFARYGGEEFVLFIKNIDKDSAYIFAEKIRKLVENDVLVIDDVKLKVTISIGISLYKKNIDESIDRILERADKMLYIAKENGRNTVVIDSYK
ncbi:MAG: diguanylate cyclase [Lachnospirales bacterium]